MSRVRPTIRSLPELGLKLPSINTPLDEVLIALAVNTLFFFMFEVWFKVPLFKGSLDPLHFLGY